MTSPHSPYPDDHDTVTPMTEEERLWRLERIRAALKAAVDDPRPPVPLEEVRRMFANKTFGSELLSAEIKK